MLKEVRDLCIDQMEMDALQSFGICCLLRLNFKSSESAQEKSAEEIFGTMFHVVHRGEKFPVRIVSAQMSVRGGWDVVVQVVLPKKKKRAARPGGRGC